jgi:hypothetical protein
MRRSEGIELTGKRSFVLYQSNQIVYHKSEIFDPAPTGNAGAGLDRHGHLRSRRAYRTLDWYVPLVSLQDFICSNQIFGTVAVGTTPVSR